MTLLSFLALLIVASICGAIGQSIAGYSLGGCFISMVVGFIGALLGQWLAAKLELPLLFSLNISGKTFPVIWAIIGSTIFSVVIGLLTRRRNK